MAEVPKVVRTIAASLTLGASITEASPENVLKTDILKPAMIGKTEIAVSGVAPSEQHFNQNYVVNQSSFPPPEGLYKQSTGYNRESTELSSIPGSFWISDITPSTQGVIGAIHNKGSSIIIEGVADDSNDTIKLREKAKIPYQNFQIETSKTDPNFIVTAGGSSLYPYEIDGKFSISSDGGKTFETHELPSSWVHYFKISPDNKYLFLYPTSARSENSDYAVYRYDIKNKTVKPYQVPWKKGYGGFTSPTELVYDQATDSYTQFVAVNGENGFYKVSYYPEGLGAVHFIMEGVEPHKIYLNKNNKGTQFLWLHEKGLKGRILEIADNQVTRLIQPTAQQYKGEGDINVSEPAFDNTLNVAYLPFNRTVTDSRGTTIRSESHIEVIDMSGENKPPLFFEKGEGWPKDGIISNLSIIRKGKKTYLIAQCFLETNIHELYIRDISAGPQSKNPWKKAFSNYGSKIPLVSQTQMKK